MQRRCRSERRYQSIKCQVNPIEISKMLVSTYVGYSRNDRAENTHDSVPSNRNTVTSATMRRRQYFRRVRIQGAVVYV